MRVAIVGAGVMGTRLALRCAAHGCNVTLVARHTGRARLALNTAAEEHDDVMYVQRIRIVTDLTMLRNSEIVCEAIPEDLAQKRALFAELEAILPEHVPIASGTSSFPPAELGVGMAHPLRLIVAHFVHPVTIVSLAEVIVPEPVDPLANAVVEGWLRRIAMQPIRLRAPITGFIVNRLQFAILREALSLVEAGVVTAAEIDAVMERALGPRWAASGPLLSVDLGGKSTFAQISRSIVPTLDNRTTVPLLESTESAFLRDVDGETIAHAKRARRRSYAHASAMHTEKH